MSILLYLPASHASPCLCRLRGSEFAVRCSFSSHRKTNVGALTDGSLAKPTPVAVQLSSQKHHKILNVPKISGASPVACGSFPTQSLPLIPSHLIRRPKTSPSPHHPHTSTSDSSPYHSPHPDWYIPHHTSRNTSTAAGLTPLGGLPHRSFLESRHRDLTSVDCAGNTRSRTNASR